jgi:hypothetical protein
MGATTRADLQTIGGLRAALADADPSAEVYIDNRPPTALSSYRGYYDHIAIERSGEENEATAIDEPGEPFNIDLPGWGTYTPGSTEVTIKSPATVGELVKALDLAVGAAFEGYKGGQFTMSADSDLWVSEYGQCDRLRVSGVEVLPGRVDLVTKEVEW